MIDPPSGTLSRPLTLPCGAVLPNRIAKAAMTEGLADAGGRATAGHDLLYGQWSDGGAGLLITGNVQIDRQHLERPGNVVLDGREDSQARAALARWAKAGTRAGNALWMQISHAGRQTPRRVNPRPKAPSAVTVALPGKQFGEPVALTEAEILDIIGHIARAARTAREAGFTGVQVHSAHGYLLSSFLSPLANRRSDAWGGSLENRARMLLEVVRATRAAVGADFAIGVKLNSADFQRGGFDFADSLAVARWLQAEGVDLLEISGGSYEQPRMMDSDGLTPPDMPDVPASSRAREAYFIDYAVAIRQAVSLPLMVTGGIRSAAAMQSAIKDDGIDMIGLGRPLCVETDAPARILAGGSIVDRWESSLRLGEGLFGPASPVPLLRALNGFAVQSWYYAQLYRLARGQPADRNLGVLSAFIQVQRIEAGLLKAMRAGGILTGQAR